MTNNFYGVFIGINEYLDERHLSSLRFAEKDARDMCETFTDPNIGFTSHEGNIELLLGPVATKNKIESILHTALLKKANRDDTVIVYYAGHGFIAGDEKTAYLGAYDSKISEIAFNPNAGLSMSYIYQYMFQKSRARNILFILDCCNSGAFLPPTTIKSSLDLDAAIEQNASTNQWIDGRLLGSHYNKEYNIMARAVLFSSPAGVASRENEQYENGVFTHFLLTGLRGDELAVEAENGEVTIDSLNSYIKRKVPVKQPSGFAGHVMDRFVLTRNHRNRGASSRSVIASATVEDVKRRTPPVRTARSVFISYRRSDSADIAGRIYDRLIGKFGKEPVFKDVDSIPLGLDFKEYLEQKVAECDVLLAIIGDHWLDASDAAGKKRLREPTDFVRIEIQSALERGIPVIPLLVRGAHMPSEESLPPSLRKLVYRNGIPIRSDPDFHRDMDRLIAALEKYI